MVCKNCGKKIDDGLTVCPHCGETFSAEEPVQLVGLAAISAEANKKKKKKLTKKQIWIRVGIIAGSVLAALAIVIGVLYAMTFGRINRESELNESDLGVNEALVDQTGVQNIALFGLDSRADTESGRSDALIILSIDRDHNAIKMTSIARDSLVAIDGHGQSKITHAFAWGGAKLAVKTLNQNFGMNITDYVYVNFFEFVELVDHVGGIMIDVNASEANIMNKKYSPELLRLGFDYKFVSPGYQRLSGAQALAYSRDRYTGSETDRGNRHKEVLQALFDEVKDMSLAQFPALIGKVMSMCHTTLTDGEMLSMATWALSSNPNFSQFSMPSPECNAKGGNWNDGHGWVWRYDMGLATAVLHKYIYEVEVPYTTTASKTPLITTTTGTGSTTTTTTGTGTTTTGTGSDSTTPTDPITGEPITTVPTDPITGEPIVTVPTDPITGEPIEPTPTDPETGEPITTTTEEDVDADATTTESEETTTTTEADTSHDPAGGGEGEPQE